MVPARGDHHNQITRQIVKYAQEIGFDGEVNSVWVIDETTHSHKEWNLGDLTQIQTLNILRALKNHEGGLKVDNQEEESRLIIEQDFSLKFGFDHKGERLKPLRDKRSRSPEH